MILKRGLMAIGVILILSGLFFALQGANIIHWPLESTMLGRRIWIGNGLALALIGALTVFGASRLP